MRQEAARLMVDVDICIVNWNTKDLLKSCLTSIFGQTEGINYRVWVVDNGSTDGSPQMVEQEFPGVRLIRNHQNVGFTKANNQVLRSSSGRYVLLLNSDTDLVGNAVKGMADFMDTRPDTGACGCMVLNKDGSLQLSCGRFPRLVSIFFGGVTCNRIFKRIFGDRVFFAEFGLTEQDHHVIREADFVKGCCIMLRKSSVEKIGFMDEGIFMYFEEIDLCYRLKQAGEKVMYTPHVQIVHLGGQSARLSDAVVARRLQGQEYFFRKHYGSGEALRLRWIVAVGSILRLLFFPVAYCFAGMEKRPMLKSKLAWSVCTLKCLFRS
jgi:hypothetical protein